MGLGTCLVIEQAVVGRGARKGTGGESITNHSAQAGLRINEGATSLFRAGGTMDRHKWPESNVLVILS